jgi:hypothetical protein
MVDVVIRNAWNVSKCEIIVGGTEPKLIYKYSIQNNILRLDMFKPGADGRPYIITPDAEDAQLLTEYYQITSLEIDSGRIGG